MHKLFLFPDAHKTGTTLLQSALEINRQLLETENFALIGRKPYYISECCEYLRKHSHKQSTSVSISGARKSLIELCDGNIDRNIILSIENIFGEFGHGPHMCHGSKPVLEDLQSMLPLHEVNLIYYVRRQDSFFESIFIQRVQKLHDQSFSEFYNEKKNEDLRWTPKLGGMAEALESGKLTVVPFESIKAGPDRYIRNMFSLFSRKLAEQVSLEQPSGHQSNLSLSEKGLELALVLFPHLEKHERKLFMHFLKSHFSKHKYPKAQMLDNEAREYILAKVRTDNEILFNKYIGQGAEKSYYLE